MAESFLDLHDYAGAEEWYQAAVELEPENVDFQLMLAHFYTDHLYRIGEGGVPAAESAVVLAPEDARTHDILGWAYYLDGRRSEAEVALSRALALNLDLVSAHFHIGSLYLNSGRNGLARHHLQRAIDLDTGGYYRSRAEGLLYELE
jgi:tetratricopeptide (TPR) repeat protein